MDIYKPFTLLFCLLVSVVVGASPAMAQPANDMFHIEHIGYAQGLSSQRVFSIVQNSDNAIWVATKNGIDRWNGTTVKSYSLPGAWHVVDMSDRHNALVYHQGQLWAYDHSGKVYRYNRTSDDFELKLDLFDLLHGEIRLNCIFVDNEGTPWYGLSTGLYYLTADHQLRQVARDINVSNMAQLGSRIYVATTIGLLEIDRRQKKSTGRWISRLATESLYADAPSATLWMGTLANGAWMYRPGKDQPTPVKSADTALSNPIRAIVAYDRQTLLLGVDGGGVYGLDRQTLTPRLLFSTQDNLRNNLLGNGIYALLADSQQNIWMGSYTGGLSVAIRSKAPTLLFTHERGNSQSIANNNVNAIAEDRQDQQWYCTDRGVSIYQPQSRRWQHLLPSVVGLTLAPSRQGGMWVGTYGEGVYYVNPNGQPMRHFSLSTHTLNCSSAFGLIEDTSGDLWVGGMDGQLERINPATGKSQTFPIRLINAIYQWDDATIAVATVNGFYTVDRHSQQIRHYASISELNNRNISSCIMSMHHSGKDVVWLGTEGGGVVSYNLHSRKLQTYTQRNGLPSDDVYSVTGDKKGRIWVSTGKGLAVIAQGKVQNLNHLEYVEREYNRSSLGRLHDGSLVYGSSAGAVTLHPEQIGISTFTAPLHITSLHLRSVDSLQARRLQPELGAMIDQKHVVLAYNHNTFTVSFESINYLHQRDIVYSYKLDGLDRSWSDYTPQGAATYTNVPPGRYTLLVRSVQLSSGRMLAEASLPITVRQPWWNTWWMWTIYLLFVATIITFLWHHYSVQMKQRYDEDKIRFFVDTAHNIRTPASLISAPLEDMQRDPSLSPNSRYLLSLAHTNVQKLHAVISQLLEFEKVEYTGAQQRVFSLADVVRTSAGGFTTLCQAKQLTLAIDLPAEPLWVKAEQHVMAMILDNLLSNACKYTPEGKAIRISARQADGHIVLQIADQGIGIPQKDQGRVFKTVFRAANAQKSDSHGTGFGLVQVERLVKKMNGTITFHSQENRGTTFLLTFPMAQAPTAFESESAATTTTGRLVAAQANADETESGYTTQDTSSAATEDAAAEAPNTLMIVEDNDDLRLYLQRLFSPDYRVLAAANGEEALQLLQSEYPDLILSDVMMPGIQGDELCHRIKSTPSTQGIPVILLTAKSHHDAMAEGLRKGADDYIPKPFSSEILRLKVSGMIANRRRLREQIMLTVRQLAEDGAATTVVPTAEDYKTEDKTAKKKTTEAVDTLPPEASEELAPHSDDDQQFIDKASRIVLENLSDFEFTINDLCLEMAMSRTLFYNRLKSLTGHGPQEFIRIIRLERAAQLLKQGQKVTDVAYNTGFVNAKYFSTLFKKEYGVSPNQYK